MLIDGLSFRIVRDYCWLRGHLGKDLVLLDRLEFISGRMLELSLNYNKPGVFSIDILAIINKII